MHPRRSRDAIYLLWHEYLIFPLGVRGKRMRGKQMTVLISLHRDGELITQVMRHLGFRAVRGSSTRGGVHALRKMLRSQRSEIRGQRSEVKDQRSEGRGQKAGELTSDLRPLMSDLIVTPDGPRGPRYVAKPGPIHLARVTGAPIFSFYVAAERAWILRTWDAFVLPMPFSRIHCYVRAPIKVAADSNHEQSLARMQSELEVAQRSAEAAYRR